MVLEELSNTKNKQSKKPKQPHRLEAPGMTQSFTLGGGFGQIGKIQATWMDFFCLNRCGRSQAASKVDLDKSMRFFYLI